MTCVSERNVNLLLSGWLSAHFNQFLFMPQTIPYVLSWFSRIYIPVNSIYDMKFFPKLRTGDISPLSVEFMKSLTAHQVDYLSKKQMSPISVSSSETWRLEATMKFSCLPQLSGSKSASHSSGLSIFIVHFHVMHRRMSSWYAASTTYRQ
jgi:hypothetical protein